MFSAVVKKSRTFSSLLCLAKEQVCRGWERAQHHAQLMNGDWTGGRNFSVSLVSLVKSASSTIAAWGLAAQLVFRQ